VLPEHGTPIDPPRPLADFTLPSQDGTPLSLSALHGKYVLLFFGYTHCPDVCPTTLTDFVQVKRALGAAASQVRFVFISVDGERDTPPVLRHFM
jgi:protein SCO1/2